MKKDILKISEVSISGVYCKHIDEAEWTVNSRFRVFTFPDAENFGNRKMTADQLEFDSGNILYDMIEYHDSVEIAYFFDPVIMLYMIEQIAVHEITEGLVMCRLKAFVFIKVYSVNF